MSLRLWYRGLTRTCAAVLSLSAAVASVAVGQGTGTVSGTVTEAVSKRPVEGVQVFVEGTRIGTLTTASGRFSVRGIPAGSHKLVARYIGYLQQTKDITVSAGSSDTVTFALQQSVNVLADVVTTGSVVETKIKESPTPINVVTAADIQRSGATRIDQVFKGQIPGLVSLQPGPYDYGAYIYSRGSASLSSVAKMKVYVDGVELADGYNLNVIDPSSIERMEVIRGPQASTVYGSEAQNGVIQIFTKKGSFNQLKPRVEATASFGGVTGPLRSASSYASYQDHKLSLSGGASDFSYNIGGSYVRMGEYSPGYINSTPSYFGSARLKLGNFVVEPSYRFSDRESGGPLNPRVVRQVQAGRYKYPSFFAYSPTFWALYASDAGSNDEGHTVGRNYGLNVNVAHSQSWTTNMVLGIDNTKNDFVWGPNFTTPDDTLFSLYQIDQQKRSITLNTNYQTKLGSAITATLTGGTDQWWYDYDYQYFYGVPSSVGAIGGALYQSIQRYPLKNSGYYAQAQVGFSDKVFLVAGARLENHPGFGDDLSWSDRTAPRVGISYSDDIGNMSFKLRASYGAAFLPPSGSMIYPTSGTTYRFEPNPTLKPERNTGADAGLELYFGRGLSFNFTYYNQSAKDLIDLQYLSGFGYIGTPENPALYQYQNVGEIHNKGIEIESRLNIGPVALLGTYTYSISKPTQLYEGYSGFAQVGKQLWRIPKHLIGGSAQYTGRKLSLGGDVSVIGKRRSLYYGPFYDRIYATYATCYFCGTLDYSTDYFAEHEEKITVNMNASYLFSSRISWFLNIINLNNNMIGEFDDDYVTEGRKFLIGMRLRQ